MRQLLEQLPTYLPFEGPTLSSGQVEALLVNSIGKNSSKVTSLGKRISRRPTHLETSHTHVLLLLRDDLLWGGISLIVLLIYGINFFLIFMDIQSA